MDTSEYMPMFLAESREHLQELNLAIVALEENPSQQDTVDGIFRIAHSLKGMSATMGFTAIAELTHVMEDVFELLRQRTDGLSQEAITTVLACLDALAGAVDEIESAGRENLDPALLIEQLKALIRDRTPEQEHVRAGGGDGAPNSETVQAVQAAGRRVFEVSALLSEDTLMPAVRAHMIFVALAEHGELLGCNPAHDSLESFEGREVRAWIASEHLEQELSAAVSDVSEVASVSLRELGCPTAAAAVHPREAPELHDPGAGTARGAQATARTVRVDAERLDALMHLMGELVIHRTAVEAYTAGVDSPGLQRAVQDLTRSSQALQQMVMNVRMIPVDVVFMRFPRLVRDLSTKLGKDLELELIGRETELDRTVVDALGDPLVHLVRNSLDHGLERPEERAAAGKPPSGKLTIAARHAGGSVVIEVRDDGRGVDPAVIASKALASGLIDAETARTLDMKGAIELLFAPGFSTAQATSDISGRGVGMDAVRAKIRELGGEVVMDSVKGAGTSAQIRLPLTLAIVSALQIEIAGAQFAIPIDRVERALRMTDHTVASISGRQVLSLEDGVLPLLDGAATFGRAWTEPGELIVIVRGDDKRVCLTVSDLVGQRELVTRPLPDVVSQNQPVSGAAVLADGQIALIIDCDALAQSLCAAEATPPTQTATPDMELVGAGNDRI